MTNSEFMNILNDDSLELTVEELENIIEEELQKDESEMDPDLIEYCLYYISKAETEGGKEKKADSAGNDKIAEPPAADKLKKSRFNGKLKNLLINSRHYRTAARHHRNCDYCHRQRNQKQRHYLLRKSYKSSFR